MANDTRPCADGKRKEGVVCSHRMGTIRSEGMRGVALSNAAGIDETLGSGSFDRPRPCRGPMPGALVSDAGMCSASVSALMAEVAFASRVMRVGAEASGALGSHVQGSTRHMHNTRACNRKTERRASEGLCISILRMTIFTNNVIR